jgi:hypothetical protein
VLFEVDNEGVPHALDVPAGALSFPVNAHLERQRAFSHDGNWFVFTTDTTTYVTRLQGGDPLIDAIPPTVSDPSPHSALVFSPDDAYFLEHRGARLALNRLNPPEYLLVSQSLPNTTKCSEDFIDPDAVGWCGAPRETAQLVWSTSSRLFGYQLATGALEVFDLHTSDPVPMSGSCGSGCVGTHYAFQP